MYVCGALQNGWSEVFVCRQHYVVWAVLEGLQQEALGGIQVVCASLVCLVGMGLLLEVLFQGLQCCFDGLWGFWWLPVTFFVQFGVVAGVVGVGNGLEVAFESDIFGETGHGVWYVWFGEWWFYAELESVPQEFSSAWWRGDHSAKVVACCLGWAC